MSIIPPAFSRRARERARRTALQALYEIGMTKKSAAEIISAYARDNSLKRADRQYFHLLLEGVCKHQEELDSSLQPFLDRPLKEIDPVEHAALSIGLYELLYQPDIPSRAVINEAVELTKMFGAEASHKYINNILDQAAHQIRASEFTKE
jgi:transcription antitermination protein NusB